MLIIGTKVNLLKGFHLSQFVSLSFESLNKFLTKRFYLLYMDKEMKKVFAPNAMISFRSARMLSNYLVRAKMYPIERAVGSKNCGSKRCEVCINVNEMSTFTSRDLERPLLLITSLTVTRSLFYLLTCRKYKIQYVGQTMDQFRLR